MDETAQTNQQDWLRTARGFVNTLSGIVNDQSWDRMDASPTNAPYQYQTMGPTGTAIEGAPISTTPGGGLVVSNGVLMLALGAAAVYFLGK